MSTKYRVIYRVYQYEMKDDGVLVVPMIGPSGCSYDRTEWFDDEAQAVACYEERIAEGDWSYVEFWDRIGGEERTWINTGLATEFMKLLSFENTRGELMIDHGEKDEVEVWDGENWRKQRCPE